MTPLSWINCIVGGVAAYSFVSAYYHIAQLIWFEKFIDVYRAELDPVAIVTAIPVSWIGAKFGFTVQALPLDAVLLYLVAGSCLNATLFEQEGAPEFGASYIVNTAIGLIFWPLSLSAMIFCIIVYWNEEPNKWVPTRGGFIGTIGPEFGLRGRFVNGQAIIERRAKAVPRRQRLGRALAQWGEKIMHSVWLCLFLIVANYSGLQLLRAG